MKISMVYDKLVRHLPSKRRFCLVGKPGVGKTYVYLQAAQTLGWKTIVISAPLEDPSTIRGYPRAVGDTATHCLFDGMAKAFAATDPTLVVFDDLGMAREATATSIIRFWQTGEIDGKQLPDCVSIGCATNDIEHGSGVYGIIEPFKTRCHTILEVETDVDDLAQYGLANDWPTDLIAFLRNNVEAIHDWKVCRSVRIDGACPRGWEYVAEWIKLGEDDPEIIAGCVGKGRAAQYLAYRNLANDLPSIDHILLDPQGAPVPERPDAQYLVACAISGHMTAHNFAVCGTYLQRLPAMIRAFSIRDALRAEVQRRKLNKLPKDHRSIATSRDFTAWAVSADGREIMAANSMD